MNFLTRNHWSIFIYPFVFWSAASLGVLDLPRSLHCINNVAGLNQGKGKWFLREGGATEATRVKEDGKNFLHQASCCYRLPQCSTLQVYLKDIVPGGCYDQVSQNLISKCVTSVSTVWANDLS